MNARSLPARLPATLVWMCVVASACGGSRSAHPGPIRIPDAGNTPDGGNPGDAGDTWDAGKTAKGDGTPCGDYAAATCNSFALCGSLVIRLLGGLDGCVALTKADCMAALTYPSTGANPAFLAKCTAALEATSPCGSTPACDVHGSLANGATCGSDWQCSSGVCDGAGPTSTIADGGTEYTFTCGQCAATLPLGAQCPGAGCMPNEVCSSTAPSTSSVCHAAGGVGDPCFDDQSCGPGLACNVTGHCARVGGAGATCVPDDHCDVGRDMFCNPTTGLCEQSKIAAAGESCNSSIANGKIVDCAAGSTCLPAVGTDQHCVPNAKTGDPCDNTNGPICGDGSVCSGGVCAAFDPASCH